MTGRGTAVYSGGVCTTPFRLECPDGLDNAAWAAIDQALTWLNTAIGANDLQLVIGCAKELTESVAKVVLVEPEGTPQPAEQLSRMFLAVRLPHSTVSRAKG